MKTLWITLCAALFVQVAGCALGPTITDDDPELTPDQAAMLPDDSNDPDHAALAAVADLPPVADDTALYADDNATATDDEAVFDDDQPVSTMTVADEMVARAQPLLAWGLHPRASRAFRSIDLPAWRIIQTIGSAAASAGTHEQDGTVNGHPYCAATDLSVSGLTDLQIRHLLERLGRVGFAAWYRDPGHDGWPVGEVRHIHAVYANARMKSSLQSQVRSWLVGRNGLVSNTLYGFYHWSQTAHHTVHHKFAESDHGTTNFGSTCFPGGLYCGGDKITGRHDTLYRCTGTGAPDVVRHCANACVVNPGQDDSCR